VAALRGVAAGAHEFSTTAGGRCAADGDGGRTGAGSRKPDSPFSDVCTWAPVSPSTVRAAQGRLSALRVFPM
jgi:hypothetical protein